MLLDSSMSSATARSKTRHRRGDATSAHTEPDETIGLLALSCIKGVGYWTLWKIRQQGRSFAQIINDANEHEVRRILKDAGAQLAKANQSDWSATRAAIVKRAHGLSEELAAIDTRVVFRGNAEYPSRLNDLLDAPYWLFIQGRHEVLNRPSVTIVGTRKPSDDGLWLTRFVGACLHELACPTVSGLAAGIDQLVHQASLDAQVPTIAVLGNGIFSDFPKGSEELRAQIMAKGGAVVTEYLPRQTYSAENFVRRNRLQAALGSALVPVEWAAKSGTAHTVKYASDLGRPIACLRMPGWQDGRAPFEAVTGADKKLFTIPGEENPFRTFIKKALKSQKSRRPPQSDFFTRE